MLNLRLSDEGHRATVQIAELKGLSKKGIRKSWFGIGKDLKDAANKLILDKNKTGRIYLIRLRGRKIRHRASAPGEAPANLTGNLRKSIDYKINGHYSMRFGERAPYARFLELGTRKIEERPHLIRSIKENERNTRQHFETHLKQELCKK